MPKKRKWNETWQSNFPVEFLSVLDWMLEVIHLKNFNRDFYGLFFELYCAPGWFSLVCSTFSQHLNITQHTKASKICTQLHLATTSTKLRWASKNTSVGKTQRKQISSCGFLNITRVVIPNVPPLSSFSFYLSLHWHSQHQFWEFCFD